MKILLINPSYGRLFQEIKGSEWIAPPLGLTYIASVLEHDGHKVRIFDMQVEETKLTKILESFKPNSVGVTFATPSYGEVKRVLRIVKKFDHNIMTVVGGPHPTALPEEVAKEPDIDVAVYGEGENTAIELFAGKRLENIEGIAYMKNGSLLKTSSRPLIENLDKLPFPAHHLLRIDRYSHPLMKGGSMSILTSRGCPFNCNFCNKGIFGRKFRGRSPDKIVDEIELIVKKYKIKGFHIIDDNFIMDTDRAFAICNKIIERGLDIKWSTPNGVRADVITRDLVKVMKKSGCYSLSFGVESGSSRILKMIGKEISLDKIKTAFEICKEEGIETVAFFIIGFPGETPDDIQKTIDFAKSIRPDIADFHMLIPLPETPVYDYLKENNLLLEKDWSKYSFHTDPVYKTKELSRADIKLWYKKAFKSYYSDPKYLMKRLVKMRSLRDVRNNLTGLKTIMKSFILKKA